MVPTVSHSITQNFQNFRAEFCGHYLVINEQLITLAPGAREAFQSWGSDFPSLPFPSSLLPSPPSP